MNSSVRSLKTRVELTDDRIAYLAPSVFASQPVAGVSDRYTFLPTSQILAGMRSEGWAPVEARQQTVRVERRDIGKPLKRLTSDVIGPAPE